MLQRLSQETLPGVKNDVMRGYASRYVDIYLRFLDCLQDEGIPFAAQGEFVELAQDAALPFGLNEYVGKGLTVANDGKSYIANWQSPACVNCQKGLEAETFLFSNECPRKCFFCFNHNQEDFESSLSHVRNLSNELEQRHAQGASLRHIALSGGEPLLYKDESVSFFQRARELYPDAYLRLYASDVFIDKEILDCLASAGLDEIRISIKTDEGRESIERSLHALALARGAVPTVMVEMPVMPDQFELMCWLLERLDAMGIDGINLLELGYAFHGAREFARRGYKIKARPYRVLYDYSYAGGVPIAGSEDAALRLVRFALERGLGLGVHYCSVENRLTGEVYKRNVAVAGLFPLCVLSSRDNFLKSAKAFGDDAALVRDALRAEGVRCRFDRTFNLVEFPVSAIPCLARTLPDVEIGISSYVAEVYEGEHVLREVCVDATTPRLFDLTTDI